MAMKVRLLILLCFVSPFLKGGPVLEQLDSIRSRFYSLPENLTIENIDLLLTQTKNLFPVTGFLTEEESIILLSVDENGGFLELLKEYLQNPTNKDLAADLERWAQGTAKFYDFLEKAIEKNPENEALKNINLDFPVWWKKNRF